MKRIREWSERRISIVFFFSKVFIFSTNVGKSLLKLHEAPRSNRTQGKGKNQRPSKLRPDVTMQSDVPSQMKRDSNKEAKWA